MMDSMKKLVYIKYLASLLDTKSNSILFLYKNNKQLKNKNEELFI